jgi:hypothetical protein
MLYTYLDDTIVKSNPSSSKLLYYNSVRSI